MKSYKKKKRKRSIRRLLLEEVLGIERQILGNIPNLKTQSRKWLLIAIIFLIKSKKESVKEI